ncbi:transcriptional regulator, LacI family [Cognatiyoonia koreensis]|uniref:Transcriptional regulator, LacI family n=1 Tax=Cognatiyoonia koreensis TaxID=364200 RepID=A0A1I0RW96_9RHOB|nr:LacI family transcriptional regulator [Cognatiyoonia koreensis]SEW45639.1 transcriptional regulator, LacI family [Cognatiyoonia koreensis]
MPSEKSIASDAKPTLKTISRISGLAVPTVSRALNDAPDIGDSTKKLIRRIADEIGYVPNRAGVRLRTGRTNVISLVMSTEHDVMNHSARLISSVAGGLRDTPYHLIVTPFFPDEDPMKPVRYIVETGSADALILNQIQPEDPRVAYLMERNFPFATHGRSNWSDRHPYFDFDNGVFGQIAADRLHQRGRKHIALLAPPLSHNYAQHMLDGVKARCDANGQTMLLLEGATSDSASDEVVRVLERVLTDRPEIDGLICASTSATMAAITAIEAHGITLGQQLDLHTKEAMPFLRLFRPDILTITEGVGTAGAFLAKAAIQAIRDPEKPPMQELEVPTDD